MQIKDTMVRSHLAAFFLWQEGVNCRIAAASAEDFLAQAESTEQLDIVLADIGLPGKSGIEAIPEIKKKFPDASVIILSVYIDSEPLTAKEQQVIAAMVDGLSYKMIAVRLGITLETVRQHIKNIYRKLQVNSKTEVIVKSLKGEI